MIGPERQRLDFLGEEVEVAPQADLPRTSFLSVEYPGVLGVETKDARSEAGTNEHISLSRALRSLSPLPFTYATPGSALQHMSQLMGKTGKATLECKLGQACLEMATQPGGSQGRAHHPHTSTNEVYRHALVGELVDAHNVVLKITKRVWRRKRRTGTGSVSSSDERREYTASALGITRKVARFRHLADFQYDPGYVPKEGAEDGREEATKFALQFHDHLRQMNIEELRSFSLEEEKEDYEVERQVNGKDWVAVSNIRLPPPPVFDRTDIPFAYGFRQNSTSELREYGKETADTARPMRYINRQKIDKMTPIQVSMPAPGDQALVVPQRAHAEVFAKHMDPMLFEGLKNLFERQPIWTRTSIENQFEPEQRRVLRNQKHHLAAHCYTINDGCWRDTLVRLGYDPRDDRESRFYQKLRFQMKDRARKSTSGLQELERGYIDDQAEGGAHIAGEEEADESNSHIFDGVTPKGRGVNFLLIDVHDELVRPLIEQEGDDVLRDKPDRDSGWYTQRHYEKIRQIMHLRFHRMHDGGEPASQEECEAIIAQIDGVPAVRPVKMQSRPKH